jgi:hypothetical protein
LVGGECQISATRTFTASTTLSIPETVHILATGKIVITAPNTLTLNIAGDLVIDKPNAAGGDGIFADYTGSSASGVAGTIIINAGDANIKGNIVLHGDGSKGATISADNKFTGGCGSGKGGTIYLAATGDITTEDGSVVTVGTIASKCSGGTIFMQGGGAVDIDGVVKSESIRPGDSPHQLPGGGPITINAGCDLTISDTGIVSSRGQDPGADLVHLQAGCQMKIIGLVQSTGGGHSAPDSPPNQCDSTYRPGKPTASTACIEIVAGKPGTGPALIIDSTDGNNGQVNADVGDGGIEGTSWVDIVTVGDIQITGDTSGPFAIHANGNAGTNDDGGVITTISTEGKITATGLAIQATGSHGPNTSGGKGGTINVNANLDVDLTGGTLQAAGETTGGAPHGGTINVKSFNTNIVSDTNSLLDVVGGNPNPTGGVVTLTACGTIGFPPGTVTPAAVTPTKNPGVCGGAPSPPSYLLPLPTCQCAGGGVSGPFCQKASVQTVLDPSSGRFPGNKGPDIIVRPDHGDSIQNAIDTVTDVNNDKYLIIGVVDHDNGLLGGNVFERIAISLVYSLPFALIACSVTLHDPNPGDNLPTAHITSGAGSPQNIFVMDLHAADSQVAGWLVEGNGRYMRNIEVTDNAVGISFIGDSNTMHNGAAEDNTGVGILIQGNGNTVDSSDSMGNGGNGVQVTGNTNFIYKVDIGDRGKGNLGDGLNVAGNNNKLQENDVFANGGNGIVVQGNGNLLYKNDVGDRGKGNGGNGIIVSGTGNGKLAPTEIEQNVVKANGGVGVLVTGSGHQLKKNVVGGKGSGYTNGGFEYDLAPGNFDSGGNKANDVSVTLLIPGQTGT